MNEFPPSEMAPLPRMLAAQTLGQLAGIWRLPAYSVSGLLLPVVFFAFVGLAFGRNRIAGVEASAYALASFATYAVSSMMVFNFGIGVSQERALKQDLLMRATPLPPAVHLLAKVISATLFALLSLLILVTFAVAVGGVRVQPLGLASMVLRLLIGSLPMMGLGFAIGYGTSANSAPAVANLIYLPLSFASGLFMPLAILPDFIQKVATYLPTYHYAQLAWSAVGARSEPLPVSILWLVGYSVLLFALAARLYRREEAIKFA